MVMMAQDFLPDTKGRPVFMAGNKDGEFKVLLLKQGIEMIKVSEPT